MTKLQIIPPPALVTKLGLLVMTSLAGFIKPCHAEWVVDRYVGQCISYYNEYEKHGAGPQILTHQWTDSGKFDLDVRLLPNYSLGVTADFRIYGSNTIVRPPDVIVALEVTPVYIWEGEDPPTPFFYVRERGWWNAYQDHTLDAYTYENPYQGQHMTIEYASNGFGDTVPLTWTPWHNMVSNGVDKWHFSKLSSGGKRKVPGPSRLLHVKLNSTESVPLKPVPYDWIMYNATAETGYTAEISHPNFTVRRAGTQDPFSGSATVAAGGKATDEHKADVKVTLDNPMAGVPASKLPRPKILFGEGANGTRAVYTPRSGELFTDANGELIIGTVKSSDKIKKAPAPGKMDKRVQIKVNAGRGAGDPTAIINQVWDEGDEWTMKPYLIGNESNVPVTFKPKFGDAVPIRQHVLKMYVSKVKIKFWNSVTNKARIRIITMDPNEVNALSNPPIVLGNPSAYATFVDEEYGDSGNGQYTGILKLLAPDSVTIEQLWFKARDQGVYSPKQ